MSVQEGVRLILKDLSQAHGRYLDEFFGLSCAPDLLNLKLYPNAKEVTESMAAYRAVRNNLGHLFALNDPEVHLFSVGDGVSPRTAAMFAFRSRWQCHSIDPALRNKKMWSKVNRLSLHSNKVEHLNFKVRKAVIVAVHSHATLEASLQAIQAEQTAVVALPCCIDLSLSQNPDKVYDDLSCWSPKNEVRIWKEVNR